MFLIDDRSHSILYTGDIRCEFVTHTKVFIIFTCFSAEPWWVEATIRNPIILPFTCGLRRLDKIYLDTTFATKSAPFRKFPTKANGIKELLSKISGYTEDTVFYFHSWTFGYEDVWIALSSALGSQVPILTPYSSFLHCLLYCRFI